MPYCIQCGHTANYIIPDGDDKVRLVCPSCHHVHYENPKVVAGVLAVHEGKILLCRRAIEPRFGFWTLPAGFMEIGETMQAGALREMYEEADAFANYAKLYALFDIPERGQIHAMYLSDIKDGVVGCGTESLECRLFAIDELPWDKISFTSVYFTLKYYLKDLQNYGTDWRQYPLHERTITHQHHPDELPNDELVV